jgi:hypothetical protein
MVVDPKELLGYGLVGAKATILIDFTIEAVGTIDINGKKLVRSLEAKHNFRISDPKTHILVHNVLHVYVVQILCFSLLDLDAKGIIICNSSKHFCFVNMPSV